MTTKLQLAPGLKLDPDYVGGGTFALLAKADWWVYFPDSNKEAADD